MKYKPEEIEAMKKWMLAQDCDPYLVDIGWDDAIADYVARNHPEGTLAFIA